VTEASVSFSQRHHEVGVEAQPAAAAAAADAAAAPQLNGHRGRCDLLRQTTTECWTMTTERHAAELTTPLDCPESKPRGGETVRGDRRGGSIREQTT